MQIIYQGVDITDAVQPRGCAFREVSAGRCDSLEIEFDAAQSWHRWNPQPDERIAVSLDGFSTGALYVSAALPAARSYRLLALSAPARAHARRWQSFTGMTLNQIMAACAAQCGMEWALFGIDGGAHIPYIERADESCLAFLSRLIKLEGGVFKAVGGRLTGIGVEYAQGREPVQTFAIEADTPGFDYHRRADLKLGALTLQSPWAAATAVDTAAPADLTATLARYPAPNGVQAGRWARGLLRAINRRAETLILETEFNPALTAMARIDIEGGTQAAGSWLVDEVEHDFFNRRTTSKLLRCIDTVR